MTRCCVLLPGRQGGANCESPRRDCCCAAASFPMTTAAPAKPWSISTQWHPQQDGPTFGRARQTHCAAGAPRCGVGHGADRRLQGEDHIVVVEGTQIGLTGLQPPRRHAPPDGVVPNETVLRVTCEGILDHGGTDDPPLPELRAHKHEGEREKTEMQSPPQTPA